LPLPLKGREMSSPFKGEVRRGMGIFGARLICLLNDGLISSEKPGV
jgi:hypothetical protein